MCGKTLSWTNDIYSFTNPVSSIKLTIIFNYEDIILGVAGGYIAMFRTEQRTLILC